MENFYPRVRELGIITVAVLTLCVELLYLSHEMRWIDFPLFYSEKESSKRRVGKILETKLNVKNRGVSSLSWYPLSKGDPVHLNDTVMTEKDSWAKVSLEGEGEIWVEPNSLISLSEKKDAHAQKTLVLQVNQGEVKVSTAKKEVRIKLKKQEIKVERDSSLTISRSMLGKEAKVQVTKGNAQIESTEKFNTPTSIKTGDIVELTAKPFDKSVAEERPFVVRELSLIPTLPKSQTVTYLDQPEKNTRFEWTGDPAEALEISSTPDFKEKRDYPTSGNSAEVSLSHGRYYWRVRSGKTFSVSQDFTYFPPVSYALLLPKSGSRVSKNNAVNFQWNPIPFSSSYRFELSDSGDFQKILFEKDLSETKIQLKLKAGLYYWRVTGKYSTLGYWPPSEAESFQVKEPLKPPKPKGFRILDKRSKSDIYLQQIVDWIIPSAFAESSNTKVQFEWEEDPRAKQYKFEISEFPSFSKVLISEIILKPTFTAELNPAKKWFWRVAGMDPDGEQGDFCEPQSVIFPEPPPPDKPLSKPLDKLLAKPMPPPTQSRSVPVRVEIRAGNLSEYRAESQKGSDFTADVNGFFWRHSYAQVTFLKNEKALDLSFSYQPLTYHPTDSLLSSLQGSLSSSAMDVELMASNLSVGLSLPVSLGVRGGTFPRFSRTGNEQLEFKETFFSEFLFGTSLRPIAVPPFIAGMDVHGFVGPLGEQKNLGLRGRLRIRTAPLWQALFPELYLSLILSRNSLSSAPSSGFSARLISGLLVGWKFE